MSESQTSSLEEAFHIALQKHQQGELQAAGAIYEKLLEYVPDSLDILFNYSMLLLKQGIATKPQKLLKNALELAPDMRELHIAKIAALRLNRNFDLAIEALSLYEEKFASDLESDAQRLLLIHDQKMEQIAEQARQLCSRRSFQEAEQLLLETYQEYKETSQLLQPIGEMYLQWGKPHKAIEFLDSACKRDIYNFNAWNQKGIVLMNLKKHQMAHESFIQALQMLPDDADLLTNIGYNLLQGNYFDKARDFFEKALEKNSKSVVAQRELAATFIRLKDYAKAQKIIRRLLRKYPESYALHELQARFHTDQGMIAEGIPHLYRALQFNPNSLSALSSLLFSINYMATEKKEKMLEIAMRYGRIMQALHPEEKLELNKNKKIRVGFVSGDFGNHPVGYFLSNVIHHLPREKFSYVGIPTIERKDPITYKLIDTFDEWLDISHLSTDDAKKIIIDNHIDVLIDLSGHTAYNRLDLFSKRAAPVQVTWLGYFATTGIRAMDYVFIDKPSITENTQRYFTEKLIELPGTRLCFSIPEHAGEVTETPAIKNGFITFGNYQNFSKIGKNVIESWIKILKAIPKSHLRIQNKHFEDLQLRKKIEKTFNAAGISTSRLSLLASTARKQYLDSHAEVDIILDSFPFPGGTTTCEALWMGVPTITLAGDNLIERQGVSLLTAAGLEDWSCDNLEDYCAKAVYWSQNIESLNNLRQSLREKVRHSALFDGKKFGQELAHTIEQVYNLHSVNNLTKH